MHLLVAHKNLQVGKEMMKSFTSLLSFTFTSKSSGDGRKISTETTINRAQNFKTGITVNQIRSI